MSPASSANPAPRPARPARRAWPAVLVAPNAFKGSLTADGAARAMAAGAKRACPGATVWTIPLADGGDGTVACFLAAGASPRRRVVRGPLGEPVEATFAVTPAGQAVVEMAAASGLALLPPGRRNPMLTSTYGTGQLIRAALDEGYRAILVGIGGSATVDGGTGLLAAMGARFLDASGVELTPGGASLRRLAAIDLGALDPRLAQCQVTVACDVDNPLCGPDGAAAVFGPQKGATPAMVGELDAGLANLARVTAARLGRDFAGAPGAGAAGGVGFALMAFLGARLEPGIDVVLRATAFDERLAVADLVMTGEGRVDEQTAHGKGPAGVARRARRAGVPVVVLAGSVEPGAESLYQLGVTSLVPVAPGPCTLEEAMANAADWVRDAAERCLRLMAAGRGPGARG